jgi:hypothetical protein
MIIEKTRYYTIMQSYASKSENEYEVYDINQNRAGYIVENTNTSTFEVYHSPDNITTINEEDYTQIDYADNFEEAVEIITDELEYDLN